MARKPRTQVDDPLRRLPEQRVQPLAPDVFVGAPKIDGAGRGLADIADALSGFSGSLGGLAKVRAAADKEQAENAAVEWGRLPREVRLESVARGVGPTGAPLPDHPVVSKVFGEDTGDKLIEEINMDLEGGKFDYLGDQPVDEYIFSRTEPARATLEQDPLRRAGFDATVNKYRDAQMKKQAELRETHRINKGKDAFFLSLGQTLQKSKDADIKDVEGQYREIMKTRKALQDGELKLNIPKQEFDNQVMAFADKIADSDPDLAVKLISDPRDGVGPIGFKSENRDQSINITKRAMAARNKAEVKTVTEKYATAALSAGLGGANLGSLEDIKDFHADGTELKVSKEDLRQAVYDKWKVYDDATAERLKETPQRRINRQVTELKRMGLVNEEWKGMFKSFASGLTEDSVQDPEKMKEFTNAATIYDQLRSGSRYFVDQHMDKPTADLMDRYWVARNRMGVQAQDTALLMAIRASDPASDQSFATAERAVKDKIEKEYDNGSQYARQLKETANGYVRMGNLTAEKAVELAAERMKSTGANVNGSYVPIPMDNSGNPIATPDDFDNLAELTIERWADKHAPPGITSGDLTLRGDPNGTYTIVDKRTGIPVIGINIGDAASANPILTAKDFLNTKDIQDAKSLGEKVETQNINQYIRAGEYGTALGMLNADGSDPKEESTYTKFSKMHSSFLDMLTRKSFWMSGGHNVQILPPDMSRSNADGTLKKPKKNK